MPSSRLAAELAGFPEYACAYAKQLAAESPRFAKQCFRSALEIDAPASEKLADPFGELSHADKCP